MALTAIALAASLASSGTCSWDPASQQTFDGDVATVVDRFQDLSPELRAKLRQRMDRQRFDELVLIRRDGVFGAQSYGQELQGLQMSADAVCAQPDRSQWSAVMAEPALSYCEARHCLLVTLNGRHVLRVARTGLSTEATLAGLDPQQVLKEQPPAAGVPQHAPGRLIVGARAGLAEGELGKISGLHGGKARRLGRSDLYVVDLPGNASEKAVQALLSKHPQLRFAELDQRVAPALAVNDPYAGSQWHLGKIGAHQAWDITQGAGITIAVLDSGIDAAHPDLAARLVPGWNVIDGNSNTADVNGHGTAVAGAAVATLNNGTGVAAVAGLARLMPVRIADANAYAYWSTVAQGLIWAADNGARVANISYGGVTGSSSVRSAAQYLKSKGGLVVVSAGNTGIEETTGASTSMITVSATDANDQRSSWSSYGSYVTLAAPGQDIWTTTRGGGYQAWWGTSLSSPVVAGVVGLMMAAKPSLASDQIESLLYSTALDLGTAGRDKLYGHGRVNAAAAVQASVAAQAPDTQAPTVAIGGPQGGSTVSGLVAVDVSASDNVGVVRVELRANGSLVASDTSAPYAFSWDSSKVANGSASLSAQAFDAAGNSAASAALTVMVSNAPAVTVVDSTPPVVAISNPANGAKVSGTVGITVQASDDSGAAGITQTLLIDGKVVATANGGTLSYSWNTRKLKAGAHSISATAKDAAGNTRSISIQVSL